MHTLEITCEQKKRGGQYSESKIRALQRQRDRDIHLVLTPRLIMCRVRKEGGIRDRGEGVQHYLKMRDVLT